MATLIQESIVWDADLGALVTASTWVDTVAYPDPDPAAYDIQQSQNEGLYTTSYKVLGDPASSSNLVIQTSCSTEPLITHPIFAKGGSHELSTTGPNSDVNAILKAEASPYDPTDGWQALVNAAPTSPLGWYAALILYGIDSFLNPTITLHVTLQESTPIDLTAMGTVYTEIPNVNAPQLPGNANWLLVGGSSRSQTSTLWRNSYEYRASALKGWSSTLYQYNAGATNEFGF